MHNNVNLVTKFVKVTHFYFLLFFLKQLYISFFFFFQRIYSFLKKYFLFGSIGSSLLRAGLLQLWRAGATLCCGARASHCGGFSCCRAWTLGAQASVVAAHGLQQLWHVGSVVVAHGLSCSMACGIFLDQGSNPCSLHWQADS